MTNYTKCNLTKKNVKEWTKALTPLIITIAFCVFAIWFVITHPSPIAIEKELILNSECLELKEYLKENLADMKEKNIQLAYVRLEVVC